MKWFGHDKPFKVDYALSVHLLLCHALFKLIVALFSLLAVLWTEERGWISLRIEVKNLFGNLRDSIGNMILIVRCIAIRYNFARWLANRNVYAMIHFKEEKSCFTVGNVSASNLCWNSLHNMTQRRCSNTFNLNHIYLSKAFRNSFFS